ncbi:hypothetical protein [Kaarinaea lacus]
MHKLVRSLFENVGVGNTKATIRFQNSGWALAATIIICLLSYGCANPVNVKHSQVQTSGEDEHIAKVYFIRPRPLKFKGIADNKVRVDFNRETLLTLNEGQYTLVKLKPSKGEISTHSKTKFTNNDVPIEVSRAREYRFIAGKTYFIHLKRVDEEFRGIFYDPAPVTFEQAIQLSERLTALGAAADEPINQIKSIAEAPNPSPLEPALPENLYPGSPYLIKGNPKYQAEPAQPTVDKNEITFDQPPEGTGDESK